MERVSERGKLCWENQAKAKMLNRYLLHEQLGKGSMGAVYRATDRLTGSTVALERVGIPVEQLEFASCAPDARDESLRLALANEFQTLASLRHPRIISVLDFGFDEQRQPFFTMEYLANARNLIDAARGKTTAQKVELLVGVLEALAYLHRHAILHRDLKPANVLVRTCEVFETSQVSHRVRVLDFGLSVARDQPKGISGTLAYSAPEVLKGKPATHASDLYTVGVLAYELFADRLPFAPNDVKGILSRRADLPPMESALAQVVGTLLEKSPGARYADASSAINAFRDAMGLPTEPEDPTIRESFLQAAQFVGRDTELAQLTDALENATQGRGSAWLVGGESGVGKSRLLSELRIRALVQGASVLRGQSVENGALPYQVWRDVLRRLALSVELSNLEAGVLKPLIPDLAQLLEREIPDAPELEAKDAQRRLFATMVRVIRRMSLRASEVSEAILNERFGRPEGGFVARGAPRSDKTRNDKQPLVLLLEDLHWADDSIELLRQLSGLAKDLPLLIVGTYRVEDKPDLPTELPALQPLTLRRFDSHGIAALTRSMLGEGGAAPPVLDLLQKETEGNVFFFVETVRALDLNLLHTLAASSLPASRVARNDTLEEWLTAAANVAVLEAQGESWRFAHEKLREVLLADLSVCERAGLHRRVLGEIETAEECAGTFAKSGCTSIVKGHLRLR